MKVAVIGAAGQMGRWLTSYFAQRGFETRVYDIRQEDARSVAEEYKVEFSKNLKDAVSPVDFTLVSVPISRTPEVVKASAQYMKAGSTLVEVASLKAHVVDTLKQVSSKGIDPLSIHPLFGPGASGPKGRKIALIPLMDVGLERKKALQLFPDAEFIEVEADEHDRIMAYVLSLTHFTNLVFAYAIAEGDIAKIRRLAGTSLSLQLTLAESILQGGKDLLASLQLENPFASECIRKFVAKAGEIEKATRGKDRRALLSLCDRVESSLRMDPEYDSAYRRVYKVADKLASESW